MTSNFRIERDGNFDYVSTGTILIRNDLRVPNIRNILVEAIQPTGSIVYDISSGGLYYSNGVSWTSISGGGGNTFSNIGLGVGVYKQTVGNNVQLKSIRSTGGVVVTDDILNDSVGIFTSLNLLTPTTATGDMIYANTASTVTRLPVGINGNVLAVSGGIPVWSALTLENILPPTSTGEIIHSNSPSTYATLPLGAAGFVLTSNGSDVVWSPSASSVNPNMIVVTKNPGIGQYPNAFSAMASIPTIGPNVPSVTNPYVIYVYPGVYQEPNTVVFKEFVYLIGVDIGGVVFEPLNPGYNLFTFVRATAMSFCSIQNVVAPNVACTFDNAGSTGYFFELLHKVNFYDCTVMCNSTLEDSYIYFEYVSFTNTIPVTSIRMNSTLFSTVLSNENFFFNGSTIDAIIIDGINSNISFQACNFQGDGSGNAIRVTNGGNLDLRDTFISDFYNGIIADLIGTNPRFEMSSVSFGVNTYNINIQNPTATGYFFGYSEYNKTIINPSPLNTFFITNQNQNVITVAPKGANFTSVYDAVQAINPVINVNITNLSTTITSAGLFTAALDTILVSATGIPLGATATFVDENTMILSLPATATATVIATFLRASSTSQYIVSIQPGTYITQSPVKVYDYVIINGIDRDTCVIIPAIPGTNLFEMYPNSSLANLVITGTDAVQYAISIPHNSNYSILKNVLFLNVNRGIEYTSITADFTSTLNDCIFIGTPGDIAMKISNLLGSNIIIDVNNMQCVQHFNNFFEISGPNTKLSIRNAALGSDGTGNVINILNGSTVVVQGMYVLNWSTVFSTGDVIPNFPYLAVTGLTFLGISGNILNITNPTTTGYYVGYVPYLQTNINSLSSFFIANKDTHIITVAKKGGDFLSVKSAVDSIVGASQTNVYIVSIGPGVFIENPITLSSYIGIRGSGYLATTIFTTNPTSPIITGADASTIEGCAFNGATGIGGCALFFAGTGTVPGSPFIVNNCVLANNTTLISIRTTVNTATMILNGCLYGASFNADVGISVVSTAGMATTMLLYNCVFQDLVNPVPQTLLFADGPGALIASSNTLVQLNGTNTSAAMRIQNGASTRIYGSTFIGLLSGVIAENVGSGPNVIIASSTFDDCDTILAINNPGTTGSFSGSIDITKVFINPASTFFIRDRVPTSLIVSKKGTDFNTVNSAISFINPSFTVGTVFFSSTITSAGLFNISLEGSIIISVNIPPGSTFTFVDMNTGLISNPATASGSASTQFIRANINSPFTIQVQPGTYIEPELVLPEYVSLVGIDTFSCVITPTLVTNNIVTLSRNADLSNLTIRGATSGVGVLIDSSQNVFSDPLTNLNSITISNCNIGIKATSTLSRCEASLTDILIDGGYTTGIFIDGALITVAQVHLYVNGLICHSTDINTTGVLIEGGNANCTLSGAVIDCENLAGSVGINISDGGRLVILSCEIKEAVTGIYNPAIGVGAILYSSSLICANNITYDVNILHPSTNGCLAMNIAERSKVFINPLAPISVTYVDPVVNSTTLAGEIFVGDNNSQTTDISSMFQHGLNLGVLQGGILSNGGGLVVDVASGVGYVTQGVFPNNYLQKVEWLAGSIPIPANSTYYVYISSLGVITINLAKPGLDFVLLGRVTTDAANLEIIEISPMGIENLGNKYDDFHRNAMGAVVATGLSVAGNVSRELTVGSGEYYYSGNVYTPSSSGPPAVYYQYNHVAGVFVHALGAASVENTTYDNLTNLVAIPAGEYVKHALYISGDGATQRVMLVIGQTTFLTLPDAVAGVNPTPPLYFTEIVIPIAGVIVQEGNATFINIIDRRPTITSSLSTLSSTLVHGNLLGLLADDHPQYLLTDGTRILAGPMDFGGNALSNIGTMNGVTIQTHASRHLPAGADPLTTAAPLANLTSITTNSTGVANSLARSDHSHAISTGVASTILPNQANATGVSANLSRADHIHNIPSGSVVSIGTANNSGAAASFALSDHVHQGLHSINANIGTLRYGDVTLQQGAGISISDTLGTFTISASSGTSEFYPSLPGGLFVAYTGGKLDLGGVVITIPSGTVAVPIFSSGMVYINPSGTVTFTLGVIGQNSFPIANFTTDGVSVTSLVDSRSYINNGVTIGSGKTILVDSVLGNNTTGYRQGTPFATIGAAIAVALSGDIIYVHPGVYNESDIIIPNGVSIQGSGVGVCFVSYTTIISSTVFTMGNTCSLSEMSITLSSGTSGVILTGVLFPTISTSTSVVKNCIINISNTTALISNIYGIRSNGIGVPTATFMNAEHTTVNVTSTSATLGLIRGVYIDNLNSLNISECILSVLAGGGVSHYGIETSAVGAIVNMYVGRVTTTNTNNTYLQSSGTVNLYSVVGSDNSVMNTLISNQLQLGNGNSTMLNAPAPASDIILSFPVITDTLVGKITGDILLNKTIVDISNNVSANSLKTTGASVTVSTAVPPSIGQALVATSATTAAWSSPIVTSGNFVDTLTFIVGNIDPTKRIGFNDGPATSGTTLTLTNNQTTSQILNLPNITATDTLVANSTGAVLTNKTITGATNTVDANALKTTGASVVVSTAAPPVSGQSLIATSAVSAGWSTPVITSGNFVDNVTFIVGNLDASKRLAFNDGPATSGTTLTLTNNQTTSQILNLPNISATDTLVGNATGAVLTNKTITGATNTVDANALKTTGASVNVSAAIPPSIGQTLVTTSATTATWQTPTITPAGVTSQIQYNLSGVLTGTSNLNIDSTDNNLILSGSTTYPTTAPSTLTTGVKLFGSDRAGQTILSVNDRNNNPYELQTSFASGKIGYFTAMGNSATINTLGINATTTGTTTTRNVATTNQFTSVRRVGVTTAGGANSIASLRHGVNQFFIGTTNTGGFYYVVRYGVAVSVATIRHFVGLTSSAAVLPSADPSTNANILGFGKDSADTNYQFMYSGATTPATKIDTGIPANTSSTIFVEIRVFVDSGSNTIGYSIEDLTPGVLTQSTISGTFGTTIPATTTLLSPQIWISNGAGGGASSLDVSSQYLETNW